MEMKIVRQEDEVVHHVLEKCTRHDISFQTFLSNDFTESRSSFIWPLRSVDRTPPHVGLRIHLIKGFAPPSNLFKSIITRIDFSRHLYSSSP